MTCHACREILFSLNRNILSAWSIFKYNPGKTNNKFITSLVISIKKKATSYCIRLGRSLWSAISCQLQVVKKRFVPKQISPDRDLSINETSQLLLTWLLSIVIKRYLQSSHRWVLLMHSTKCLITIENTSQIGARVSSRKHSDCSLHDDRCPSVETSENFPSRVHERSSRLVAARVRGPRDL